VTPEVRRELRAGDRVFMVGLFAVALALRLYVSSTLAGEPVWDGHYYEFGARHIASGFGYADEVTREGHAMWHPWCHYPVGYSAFLAGFYKLFGTRHVVAHFANALVGGLLPVVTYLLGREALSPARAKVAGALVALHPGLVLYGALLMTEPLSALLVLGAFYVAIRVARGGRPMVGIAAGGFVLGLAILVRPQALLCAPFLVLALPREGDLRVMLKKRALGVALAGAMALLTVLPWTARNCRVMDGCALVSTNAGWNLAIGSFPRATGRFETLRSEDGCREVTGQVQQDRCWLEYGLANIRKAPGRWLALIPAKLAYTFDHESFAVEYLREARPAAWPEDRRVSVRSMLTSVHRVFVAASALAFVALALKGDRRLRRVQGGLLAALAIAAYAAFAADTPTFWPIVIVACVLPWLPLPGRPAAHPALLMSISLLATTALAHAIFFGEDRYHVVASPVLCLLAAAALRAPRVAAVAPEDAVAADPTAPVPETSTYP
jgi:4-amino-4-deoxy-L-arabinose transferase-like glycosyltransferase